MALYCFAWFQSGETANTPDLLRKRQTLLYTLLICIPAIVLTRLLAATLPFSARPIVNPDLHLRLAYHLERAEFVGWSSFPSDHAVMFFALATGMYLVSRRLGLLLYAQAIFLIALPRIFLGIHYPSDIIGGALIGFLLAYTGKWNPSRTFVTHFAFKLQEYSMGLFYVCIMFLLYETAGMYWNLVHTLMLLSHRAETFFHRIPRG